MSQLFRIFHWILFVACFYSFSRAFFNTRHISIMTIYLSHNIEMSTHELRFIWRHCNELDYPTSISNLTFFNRNELNFVLRWTIHIWIVDMETIAFEWQFWWVCLDLIARASVCLCGECQVFMTWRLDFMLWN